MTKKVRLTQGRSGYSKTGAIVQYAGQVVEVDLQEAQRMLERGHAEEVPAEVKQKKAD